MASSASLTLTPGSLCHGSPELFNPKPDWSLQDLKEELDALSSKFYRVPTEEHTASSNSKTASYSFSWRDLSVVADFGRGGRPFRISAFDDDSESEEDDMPEVQSRRHDNSDACGVSQLDVQSIPDTIAVGQHDKVDSPASGLSHSAEYDKKPWLLRRSEVSEGLMLELEHERLLRVQEEVRQRRSILESSIEEESVKAAASIQRVVKEEELRKVMAHRLDQQYLRSIAEVRDTHLSALQREHEQRSQVEERKIRKEAEARKRELLVREEKERQEKLKAEAEAKKKAEASLAAEALRKKQAEAAAAAAFQRAEAERLAKAEAAEQSVREQAAKEKASLDIASKTRATSEPKPIVSKAAADLEQMRHMKLEALLGVSQSLQMNASLKKVLKVQERNLTKLLQQVSATQDQVRTKSMHLLNELAPSAHQPFVVTTFASKLMSQCETQVLKLPSFPFALAQVVVNISSRIPEVMDVVLATLNQVCIFTVPKYYVFKKSQFENEKAYFKICGYKEDEGKLETTDDYVARMTAYVTLYAAITQAEIDGGANAHGLKEGWAWCARLLNNLPADRLTASALEAYLNVAGFRLCQVYNKSFMKVLHVIATEFIQNLKKQDDPDSRAVVNRLETYIMTKQFLREPDGRRMSRTDMSSSLKS